MTTSDQTGSDIQAVGPILGIGVFLGAMVAARWLQQALLVADVPLFHLLGTGLVAATSLCVVSALGAAVPYFVLLWLSPRPGPWGQQVLVPAGVAFVLWTVAVLYYAPVILPFAPWYLLGGLMVASAAVVLVWERLGAPAALSRLPVAIGGPVLLVLGVVLLLLPSHAHQVMPRFLFPRWVASRHPADSTCQGGRVWEPVLASTRPSATDKCQSLYLLMLDEEEVVLALEEMDGSCPLEPATFPADPEALEWMVLRNEDMPEIVVTRSSDFAKRACGVVAGGGL